MLGVRSADDWVKVYHNVEWVSLLQEGSCVLVQVPHITHPIQSTIHFIGYLPMESGVHFGVEFLVSIYSYKYVFLITGAYEKEHENLYCLPDASQSKLGSLHSCY